LAFLVLFRCFPFNSGSSAAVRNSPLAAALLGLESQDVHDSVFDCFSSIRFGRFLRGLPLDLGSVGIALMLSDGRRRWVHATDPINH
jgi:hypothetical protein